MLNEKFSDIQEDYLKAKEVYELSLEKLLNQAPNFSKDTLNNINSNFSKFHTKFEEFLTNISSENYDLSKTQIQDVLASIQNILDASIKYWNIIGNVSEKLIGSRFKPQNNFFELVNLYFSFDMNPSMGRLFLINSCSKTFAFLLS